MQTDKRALKKTLRTDFDPSIKLRLIWARFRARQALHLPALWSGAELDRPIFIIGAPRSGTSLLYRVLRASSKIAHWPGEAHEVWEADHHPALRGWSSNALSADDLDEASAARIKRAFVLTTGRGKRLLDKTPRNALRVGFVDALFPDARYVFLQRDGRENVNSLINAWRTARYRTYRLTEPHSIPGVDPNWWKFVLYPGWRDDSNGPLEMVCAKQWVASNEHALKASNDIDPERWTVLKYEDLVERPVEEISRVTAAAGLPFEKSIRERAESVSETPINVVTPPERGKWKRENPEEIEAILDLIGPTMKELGYQD